MYNRFYNFRSKAFTLLPDGGSLYLGATHRTAYSLLEYGLLSEAPFMVLTGDPGMGKTSLLQKMIAEHREQYSIGFVTNARYDVEHLLPWILLALGLSAKDLDHVEAYHILSEFLAREHQRNRRVVVIVDEAQSLGVALLEELRLLSNINQDKQLQLQIILSGQPDLHQLLQRVDMTQFAQRVVVDYHLHPLTEEEVVQYIRHRLQVAGGQPQLFTTAACNLASRLSQGNPRLINQICEMALTYGFAQQAPRITAKMLAQAAIDRRKNKILPLAAHEDLQSILTGPEEVDEAMDSISTSAPPAEPVSILVPPTTADPEGSYQKGLSLRRSGEFRAAIEQFEQAAVDPSCHLKSYGQIGLCYKAMGEPHQAVLAFRKAVAYQSPLRQDNLSLRYLLGTTLEQVGEVPEAIEHYTKISRADRTFKDVLVRLSRLEKKRFSTYPHRHGITGSFIGRAWKNLQQIMTTGIPDDGH